MTIRRLFALLLLLAVFAMALVHTTDPDLWWHLRTGEAIVEQRALPRTDLFSFTVPDHTWITHEWLSQTFMWLVYRAAGLPGLTVVFAGLTAAAFGLAYRACRGRPYVAGFLTLIAAVASSIVFGARPQVFNLLGAGAFVLVMERRRQGTASRRSLWLLPALTVLWANLHSGYLLGVALLAVGAGGAALDALLARATGAGADWRQARDFALTAFACFLAAALNPSGPALWRYPFDTLGSNAMQAHIQEWQSPDFHVAIFWTFGLLLVLGFLGMLFSDERPAATDLLLFLGAGAAGLQSARNIPLFAIVALPILARHWTAALARNRALASLATDAAAGPALPGPRRLNGLLLLLAVAAVTIYATSKIAGNEAAIAARFPVAAVDFIETTAAPDARIYNSYGWGGYLIWRGWPVFVDGRADVYGDAFLFNYVAAYDVQPNWREPLDAYDVDLVLMERQAALATLLEAAPGWRRVYADDLAAVFARARP